MQSIQEIASRCPRLRYPKRSTDSRLGILEITRAAVRFSATIRRSRSGPGSGKPEQRSPPLHRRLGVLQPDALFAVKRNGAFLETSHCWLVSAFNRGRGQRTRFFLPISSSGTQVENHRGAHPFVSGHFSFSRSEFRTPESEIAKERSGWDSPAIFRRRLRSQASDCGRQSSVVRLLRRIRKVSRDC
jgi:hypothetical protein